MRLFIAIFPSKEFLDYFRDVIREYDTEKRNLKPINLEQIHLTLRFIGNEVSGDSKNIVVEELVKQAGQLPKPLIHMDNLSFGFRRQHDPRVLLANITPNYELDKLVDKIHRVIRAQHLEDTIQWKVDMDKTYHMSIARLKPAATRSTGKDIIEITKNVKLPYPPDFVAKEIVIMESIMTRQGPVYRKLEHVTL